MFLRAGRTGAPDERAVILPMIDLRNIRGGTVHELPEDLEGALQLDPQALATWEDITPLARNEWICWVQSPKKAETRRKRILWGCSSLRDGKRRPCCWPGCPHR
jgi:hypothetical protein